MTTRKGGRREFLVGGAAIAGIASCRPGIPGLSPTSRSAPQPAPANVFLPLEVIDPSRVDSLLGTRVSLTSGGGIALGEQGQSTAGKAVASTLASRMPRELQVNHQLALHEPDAKGLVADPCRWVPRSRIRLEDPLESFGFQPHATEDDDAPRIRELLVGARWVTETSCGYERLQEGIVAIGIGGVSGPPGRVSIRWRTDEFIEITARTTPWTRVVVHESDPSDATERLVWASNRHTFIRRLPLQTSLPLSTEPAAGYRSVVASPLRRRASTFAVTFLAWEAPDFPPSRMVDGKTWREETRGLPREHYRIVSVPAGT